MKPVVKSVAKNLLLGASALCFTALAAPAFAADGPARLALVINQANYDTLTDLPDTDAEAAQIKSSLTQLGFDVTSVRDVTVDGAGGHPAFKQTLTDFRRKVAASPGAIAFIYYTGHGMADPTDGNGENYLLGTDADIKMSADLPASGIKLSDVTLHMSRAGAKALIIVLDACRDTPTIGKGVTKGLVPVTPEENTLIAYSTELGRIAEVGVYAPVLAKEMLKPGLKITDVFTNVQIDVSQATGQKQHPWVNNRIYDVICLASCEVSVSVPVTTNTALSEKAQMEQTFWQSIQGCDDYRAYLETYPGGTFSSMAKGRLNAPACKSETLAAAAPATEPEATVPPATIPGTTLATTTTMSVSTVGPITQFASDAVRCDIEAGNQFDADRPSSNPFVPVGKMVPDRAIAVCQAALDADPGNRHLMYNLAEAKRWAATPEDTQAALKLLSDSARKGSAASMYSLGVMYSRGEGIPQDDKVAKQWFELGAQANHAEAVAWLGIFASSGRAGPVDNLAGFAWNLKAAAMGVNYAMANVAASYYYAAGVPQDYNAAAQWYEKAANADYTASMFALAHLYEQGLGVPLDYGKAMTWYQKAAAGGDVTSMAMLGNMYYTGEGVTKDDSIARQWYERAGSFGNVASMAMAGAMYHQAIGGTADLVKARYWYQMAASKGDTWAQNALLTLPN